MLTSESRCAGFTANRLNWGYEEGGCAWLLANDPQFRRDGQAYRIIMLEARGAGRSQGAPGPFTIDQQADDVLELTSQLGLDTFTFCGHSMGGGVGWRLLCTAKDRLRRAVLLAPIPSLGVPNGTAEPQQPRTHVLQHYGWLPVPSFQSAMQRCELVTEARPRDSVEWLRQRATAVSQCPEQYWVQGWASIVNFRIPTAVDLIETPVLVIAGAADGLLKANVKDCMDLPNGTLCVLAAAGHETAHHDPVGTAAAIHAFLGGHAFSIRRHLQTVTRRVAERGLGPPAKL
jgi:pimeloyl-ACP methyl ester carboxylesterase